MPGSPLYPRVRTYANTPACTLRHPPPLPHQQGFGDGSLYVSTVPEMSFLILYLLFNLFLGAYILGTVTMLVVKGDEQSKAFRERVNQLNDFSKDNDLPQVAYRHATH